MTVTLNTLAGIVDLEDKAIELIREHEPKKGYNVAFSGGKDSITIYDLVKRAGVKFVAQYHHTTVDPPELMKFINTVYPEIPWSKPKTSMYKLILKKGFLPTSQKRYCCDVFKEMGKRGDVVITGIRREESASRRERNEYEESTRKPGLFFVNPIIHWTSRDIWKYINERGLEYCILYDSGYSRIGCIMCPLSRSHGMLLDKERYPKHYQTYLKTIQKLIEIHPGRYGGKSAEDIMHWWIFGEYPIIEKIPTVQMEVIV